MTTVAETAMRYDDWYAKYGFGLWGEFGETNEIAFDDPRLNDLLAQGRIVSLADYGCDCEDEHDSDTCAMLNGESDWVMEGWALVNVERRVVLPEGWKGSA